MNYLRNLAIILVLSSRNSMIYCDKLKRDSGYIHIRLSSANLFPPSTVIPYLQFSDGINATTTWNPQYDAFIYSNSSNQNIYGRQYDNVNAIQYQNNDSVSFNSGRQNQYFIPETQLQQQNFTMLETETPENYTAYIQNYSIADGGNSVTAFASNTSQQHLQSNSYWTTVAPVGVQQHPAANSGIFYDQSSNVPPNNSPYISNQKTVNTSFDLNSIEQTENGGAFHASLHELFLILTLCISIIPVMF